MRIRFSAVWQQYNAGEIAGIEDARARELCEAGIAVACDERGREIRLAPKPAPAPKPEEPKGAAAAGAGDKK